MTTWERIQRHTRLTKQEVEAGVADGPTFVPFEKGDDSDGGLGARWRRENPLVIDWSRPSVGLLRARAGGTDSRRKPYFRNERLWGQGGVTWNNVTSYLRARAVPEGTIFGHKAPTIAPTVGWLTPKSLMALLNTNVADFIVRTFLGSRMMIEVGDLRRLPIPVLDDGSARALDELGGLVLAAKQRADEGADSAPVVMYEREIISHVRDLYGFRSDDDLWVVR